MDLMIDLETLGTAPGCAIVSIGAVLFDRSQDGWPRDVYHELYERVVLSTCRSAGLTIEAETLEWWMDRAERWPRERGVTLQTALGRLSHFIEKAQPSMKRLWAHGAAFDPPILAAAYRAVGGWLPWHRHQIRDTRTLFDLADTPLSLPAPAHHALEDARAQARAVQAAMQKLQGGAR